MVIKRHLRNENSGALSPFCPLFCVQDIDSAKNIAII